MYAVCVLAWMKASEKNELLKRRAAEVQMQASACVATHEQMKTKALELKASLVNICL